MRYYQLLGYTTIKASEYGSEEDYTFQSTIRYGSTVEELLKREIIGADSYSKISYIVWGNAEFIEEVILKGN